MAQRLLYHSTLGSKLIKKKRRNTAPPGARPSLTSSPWFRTRLPMVQETSPPPPPPPLSRPPPPPPPRQAPHRSNNSSNSNNSSQPRGRSAPQGGQGAGGEGARGSRCRCRPRRCSTQPGAIRAGGTRLLNHLPQPPEVQEFPPGRRYPEGVRRGLSRGCRSGGASRS